MADWCMGQYVIVHSMVDTGKVPYLYSNNDLSHDDACLECMIYTTFKTCVIKYVEKWRHPLNKIHREMTSTAK